LVLHRPVDDQHLREVTPLGEEDHDESRREDASRAVLDDQLLLAGVALARRDERRGRARREQERQDEVDNLLGQDLEERGADGHRDHDVHEECTRRPEPHREGAASGRHHQRREHRLVGQLPDEDDGKDRQDDPEVHCYAINTTGRGTARR
jgi:hypothetical protein